MRRPGKRGESVAETHKKRGAELMKIKEPR